MEAKFKIKDKVDLTIDRCGGDLHVKGEVVQVIPMIKYIIDTEYGSLMCNEAELELVKEESSGIFKVGDYVYSEEHRGDIFKVAQKSVSSRVLCVGQITGRDVLFDEEDLLGISDDYAKSFISKALKKDSKGG